MTIDASIPILLWMILCAIFVGWLFSEFQKNREDELLAGFIIGIIIGVFSSPLPLWILTKLGCVLDWSIMEALNGGHSGLFGW